MIKNIVFTKEGMEIFASDKRGTISGRDIYDECIVPGDAMQAQLRESSVFIRYADIDSSFELVVEQD